MGDNYKQVVKETSAGLDVDRITGCFYHNLFAKHPQVKAYFNQTHQREGTQPRALAASVCAYAQNIDNLSVLLPAVNRIAHKHCAFNVTPDLYPVVGENLLNAIQETHGVEPDVLECWEKAYGDLANVFIELEKEIYARNAAAEGGWAGFSDWTVEKKEKESDEIVSVYFVREEGAVPLYKPGQYITIKSPLTDEDGIAIAPRNYSISDWSRDHLRISVKHEVGDPDGISSSWIHNNLEVGDKVPIAFPCGDFFLEDADLEKDTIVLVAGGIGITPLLSMFKYLAMEGYPGKVVLIHSARTRNAQSHREEALEIASSNDNFSYFQFITREEGEKTEDLRYGRIVSEEVLAAVGDVDLSSISVKTCGTKEFMKAVVGIFHDLGVQDSDISYEYFTSFEGGLSA